MSAAGRRSESGATLIEILVAVVVIGVGFVAILGGLGTSFALSAFHREQARTEAEVRRYAEAVKVAAYSATCPATYTKVGIPFVDGADFTADEPVVVDYRSASTGGTTPCSTVTTPVDERPLQVVRLTVTSAKDSRAVETIDVIKRPTT